jgi:hypothetical protein
VNEEVRQRLSVIAKERALEVPVDADRALRAGMRAYRRRVMLTYAAAVLLVVVLSSGLVWAWAAADGGQPPRLILVNITVTPAAVSLVVDGSRQLRATGVRSDGSTADDTDSTVWSSGDSKVADIDSKGLVRGIGPGTTTITATQDGITGTATVTVKSPAVVLTTITIAPDPMTMFEGDQQQATASGVYSNGLGKRLGGGVTWSSGDSKVADIDSKGLVRGIGPGTTTITATQDGITGTAKVIVNGQIP